MILCIDSGNTRIKWALWEGERWRSEGALAQADIGRLGERLQGLPPLKRIMVANVAGPAAAAAIAAAFASRGEELCFVRSEAAAAGVVNQYAEPARLGVDRWCALIGARQAVQSDCLVVGAGTATTIDTLDRAGHFLGGLILPGLDLMQKALASNTAGLALAAGRYEPFPRCTEDAILSGCLEAQAGAVERAFTRIAGRPGAQCLLFGGAAPRLAERLSIPWQAIDTLVLDGLLQLAGRHYG